MTLLSNFSGIVLVAKVTASGSGDNAGMGISSRKTMCGVEFSLGTDFFSSVAYTMQRLLGMQVHIVLGLV